MASLVRIFSAHTKESDDGTNLVFTIVLDQADPSEDVTVEVSTVEDTAEAGSDFTALSNQKITFKPGETTQTIDIPIVGDTIYERTETFFVRLANPSANAAIDPAQGEAVGTILNDDAIPTLSIDDVEVNEDNTQAILTVTRTGQTTEIVTVSHTTVDGQAKTGADYTKTSGKLIFLPDETTKQIIVPILDDTLSEANETFLVKLSGASNATITKAEGIVTLTDNDPIPSLSIENVTIAETAGGINAVFTVTLSTASGQPVTVKYATTDDTAVAGQDYTATSGTLTFAPGIITQQITVPILDDLKFELEESFFVNLSDAVGANIAQGQGTGTITDGDPEDPVFIAIDDVTVTEGNSGTTIARFTVSLSRTSSRNISVDYALAHDTTTASDVTLTPGTLQFAAGETSKTIEAIVNGDTVDETDETFFVNLSNPNNAEISDGQGKGIIIDDDGIPTLSINDITIKEGNSGTIALFTVSLSNPTNQVVTVKYATSDGTARANDGDYTTQSGTLTFNPGELSKPIEVAVNGDGRAEPDETFLVTLSDAVNATLGKPQGQATLENDDALPQVSISDVRNITEGDIGSRTVAFVVSLSNPDTQPVTVDYETVDDTATTADKDYVSAKGQLKFEAGEVRKAIIVTVNGDTNIETNETFMVKLSNASANAEIARTKATATIINDDKAPRISIDDVTVKEGNSGTTKAIFQVSLDKAHSLPVTVDYKTLDETATTVDNEYVATSGQLTFNPGQTSQTITVLVKGDTQLESDETFLIELSNAINATIAKDRAVATIQNDDTEITLPPNPPDLSVNDIRVLEGNSGTTDATFTLSLSKASSESVTVNYETVDETATVADGDYRAVSLGSVTFAPGETIQIVKIAVNGDTTVESDEIFRLNLTNPKNVTISKGSGIATLLNDDTSLTPPPDPTDSNSDGKQPGNVDSKPVVFSGTPDMDVITGGDGDDTIYGLEGDDILDGGSGNDFLDGGAGNDTLYGNNGIDLLRGKDGGDWLWGRDGDDVIYGGKGPDQLYGENGNDRLYGKKGNDQLSGGEGDDRLVGNFGVDRLTGGAGKDQFGFRVRKDQFDRITDFSVREDTILLEQAGFKAGLKMGILNAKQFQIGKRATDGNDRFIYNRATGALYFDKDGVGGAAQLQIAQLFKGLSLTHRNILVVAEL